MVEHHADTEAWERLVRLPGTSNLRDFGGYPAAGGRQVRRGQLYRSGAMPKLGPVDWEWMQARAIATVCDLRSDQEREVAPTLWRGRPDAHHIHASYDGAVLFSASSDSWLPGRALNDLHQNVYPLFAELLAPVFAEMFAALLDARAPLIVHCSAGQDRTGLAVGLVLTALGVPRPLIFEDYLLSTQARRFDNELDRVGLARLAATNVVARFYADALARHGMNAVKPRPLVDPEGQPLLALAFSALEGRWGGIDAYLEQKLGIGPAAVARLRELYLTDG